MKTTYTRTMAIEDLVKATVKLYITEDVKWENEAGEIEVEYTGVKSWDIISGGEEAAKIEAETDRWGRDENHEYLVLHFENGETSTFRNSHVFMFIR